MENSLRILQREWKYKKPYLPKSTSLPNLCLFPINRPVFRCYRCGFINTLIPLCLWCYWTSDEAHREFENSIPRPRRRASAPPRSFWHVPISNLYQKNTDNLSQPNPLVSKPTSTSPHVMPPLVCSNLTGNKAKGIAPDLHSLIVTKLIEVAAEDTGNLKRFSHSDELGTKNTHRISTTKLSRADDIEPGKHSKNACRSLQVRRLSWAAGTTPMPAQKSLLDSPTPDIQISSSIDHLVSTNDLHQISAPVAVVGQGAFAMARLVSPSMDPEESSLNESRPRTLRRMARFSVSRSSMDSTTLQSISNFHQPSSSPFQLLDSNETTSQIISRHQKIPLHNVVSTHVRSQSHPSPQVNTFRIGHPRRPYYSAIRKHTMSPATLHHSPSSQRLRAQSYPPATFQREPLPMAIISQKTSNTLSVFPSSEDLNNYQRSETVAMFPSLFGRHAMLSGRTSGFSMSGETELRMVLDLNADPDNEIYHYNHGIREYGHIPSLMGRVKKLRKILKQLFPIRN